MSRIRLLALASMTIASGVALVDITRVDDAPTQIRAAAHAPLPGPDAQIDTAMHRLNLTRVPAPQDHGTGGALLAWRDGLLFVGRDGALHRMRDDLGGFDRQPLDAAFDLAGQEQIFATDITRLSLGLRDAAIREHYGQIDLVAMHTVGYDTLDCVTVAVSQVTLAEAPDGTLSQVGDWTRVFEGGRCRTPAEAHLITPKTHRPMTVLPDGHVVFEASELPYSALLETPEIVTTDALPAPEQSTLWSLAPQAQTAYPHDAAPTEADVPHALIDRLPLHGALRLTGTEFPRWHGDVLAGSTSGNGLVRFRIGAAGQLSYHEDIVIGHKVRALAEDSAGRLAIKLDWQPYVLLLTSGDRLKSYISAVPKA